MKKIIIIFDFDGVILKSHTIKARAFYELFKMFGKTKAVEAQQYHLSKAGISRFKKFNYIKKNILRNIKIKNKELNIIFRKYCLKRILKMKIDKRLLYFLQTYHKKMEFYISTGSPQREINEILKKKKLHHYFRGIYGSPSNKVEHIKKIKKKNAKIIFIGDSQDDIFAAKKTNTNFLLRIHTQNRNQFYNTNIKKLYNYSNLMSKINNVIKNC
jgi:hypothetical protein